MSSETDNLERQAEKTRARLADTAESLRSKMSPGQMIDEFTSAFRGGDGLIALGNLKTQVRDNPLPLALMGAGLAWLLLGKGGGSTAAAPSVPAHSPAGEPPYGQPPVDTAGVIGTNTHDAGGAGVLDRAKSAISGVYEAGTDALQSAADSATGTLGAARDAAGATGKSAYDGGMSAAQGAARKMEGLPRMLSDLLEREPLMTAALGVAVGLAIGTILPRSDIEDEHLGAASDDLKEQAKGMVSEGIDHAKSVASESLDALQQAADDEGLTPGDTPLADRVGSVLKTAVSAGESAVQQRLGDKD